MTRKPIPPLRAQLLGRLLRDFREQNGLTLVQAGGLIHRDQSAMSRMESGVYPVRPPDLHVLLAAYGVTDPKLVAGLDQLSREISVKGWWDEYADVLPSWFLDFPWFEERARAIKSYDAISPHGLLQTREYAEAIICAVDLGDNRRTRRAADYRMTRQRVLDKDPPLAIHSILDESVLRRPVGGIEVTRRQLECLAEQAELPNIEVRVLPLSVGAHAGSFGTFQVFEMPDFLSDIAWADTLAGAMFVEADQAVYYTRAYASLQELALPPDESRRLILSTAEDLL